MRQQNKVRMDYDGPYTKDALITQQQAVALNNFYKLHYPNKKQAQAASKASNKLRSKSVISVLHSSSNQQIENSSYNIQKNSIRKLLASKQLRSQSTSQTQHSPLKYKESISFKTFLSTKCSKSDFSSLTFPFNDIKEIQELGKKNINVRMALQRSKDEKIKMNKIIMSHKQNQEVKLQYLKTKKEEIQNMINEEISAIYDEFFRREYQAYHGVEEGEDKFQTKLALLVNMLSKRVFNTN